MMNNLFERVAMVVWVFAAVVIFSVLPGAARAMAADDTNSPFALYLSWQQDPTTTMTVQWITEAGHRLPNIEYWTGGDERLRADVSTETMVFTDRTVHTSELTGLVPGTEYRFRMFGSGHGESTRDYSFRTMPSEAHRPLRIAIGGDIRHRAAWMERTNRQAMRFDPDFMVWGGDHAYADGKEENLGRWDEFLRVMMDTLITDDGRVVPVVMAIGNHEVNGGYYWGNDRTREGYRDTDAFRSEVAPYFYNMFAFPGHPGYNTLDFGDYLSLIVLDTDHSGPVEGTQTQWLAERLAEREGVTHVVPIYHVPAFPSVRRFEGGTSTRIREHWVPLFEEYGVRLAFEHHDHAYKRTVPIRGGAMDETGITYIGDGAWGVGTRDVHDPEQTWYLERAESKRHFILMTIAGEHLDLKAIDEDGELIDHAVIPAGATKNTAEHDAAAAQTVVQRFARAVLDFDLEPALELVVPGTNAHREVQSGVEILVTLDRADIPLEVRDITRSALSRAWEYTAIGEARAKGDTAVVLLRRPDHPDTEVHLIRVDGRWLINGPDGIIGLR